jgi:general secretion pathway protein B
MSYILDALKKSERERRLRQSVSLDQMLLTAEAPTGRSWLTWAIAIMALLNAVALGYFFISRGGPATPAKHEVQKPVGVEPEKIEAAGGPALGSGASRTPPPDATAPPAASGSPQGPIAPAPPRENATASPVARAPMTPLVKPKVPERRPVEPIDTEAARKGGGVSARDPLRERTVTPVTEEPQRERPEDSPGPSLAQPEPSVPEPRAPRLPWLEELPPDFQSRVPPLRINLFAYGSRPEDRFVVINMGRYQVGDVLPPGIRLERIDEDSLTLRFEGKRFRLARP